MNILLSYAGDKTEMIQFFKRVLKNKEKVFACDCELNYSLTQADGYFISPKANDESYVSVLTDYCKKKKITVIIPLSDADLSILSKNKNMFRDLGISVIVSSESIIDISIDRWKTFLFLESIGIKQPLTHIDLEAAKRDIETGVISFPLFLKPRYATEKTKGIDVDSLEELDLFYSKMMHKINAPGIFRDKSIVIQEDLLGDKYSLCILNDLQGDFVTAFAMQKMTISEEKTFVGQVVEIQPFEKIIDLLSSFRLKHTACLEIDCCLQKSGEVTVTEIYARFGQSYPFWHIAGADIPKQIIQWMNGQAVSSEYINPKTGVKGCRENLLAVNFEF